MWKSLLCAGIFSAFGLSGEDAERVGQQAPVLKAVDQDEKEVDFAELYKRGKVLVYFYPKADTPGCTAQSCSLRDAYETLTDAGVIVVGVSTDDSKAQKRFQKKYNLPFILVADADKKVVKAFGVPTIFGFAKRQAFLIIDGKIAWYDSRASTKKQAEDVLGILEQLKKG
ncbi:MAG: peroxiredoxin [Acidobacteria bacterium]|nr:MAG: peroxiredoxin [Acidobacteriota bacterium]